MHVLGILQVHGSSSCRTHPSLASFRTHPSLASALTTAHHHMHHCTPHHMRSTCHHVQCILSTHTRRTRCKHTTYTLVSSYAPSNLPPSHSHSPGLSARTSPVPLLPLHLPACLHEWPPQGWEVPPSRPHLRTARRCQCG